MVKKQVRDFETTSSKNKNSGKFQPEMFNLKALFVNNMYVYIIYNYKIFIYHIHI